MPEIHLMLVDTGKPCLSNVTKKLPSTIYSVASFKNTESLLIHALRSSNQNFKHRCALLKHHDKGMSGLEAQQHIRKIEPDLITLIYCDSPTPKSVIEAWHSGADDYLIYPFDGDKVHESLLRIQKKFNNHNEPIEQKSMGGSSQLIKKLTLREKEVMNLIVQGETNNSIVEKLNISIATVKMHRANLMRKLCVHNAAQLANLFHKETLITSRNFL